MSEESKTLVSLNDDSEKERLKKEITKAENKEKIKELYYVKRQNLLDVMRELNLGGQEFYECLDEIKQDLARNAPDKLRGEIAVNVYNSYRHVLAQAWFVYENSKTNNERIKALQLISETEEKNILVLQEIGVLPKPEVKAQLTVKHDFDIMMDKWREQRRKERIIEGENEIQEV